MTDTTDASREARFAKIRAEGRDKLPAWLNVEAIEIDWDDVEYRREHVAQGVLLVDALARWVKRMLPVSDWPEFVDMFEREPKDELLSYFGYDAIEYVVSFVDDIYRLLEHRSDAKSYDEWANDPERRDVWEVNDPIGWFDLRLEPLEADGYVEAYVAEHGGTVTWAEGGPR